MELAGSQEGAWCEAAPTLPELCYQSCVLTLHLLLLKSGRGNLIIYPAITLQPMRHVAKNCTKPPATDCLVINRCRTYITEVTRSCRAGLQINDIYEVSCYSWLAGCWITGSASLQQRKWAGNRHIQSRQLSGTCAKRVEGIQVGEMILCKTLHFHGVLHSHTACMQCQSLYYLST